MKSYFFSFFITSLCISKVFSQLIIVNTTGSVVNPSLNSGTCACIVGTSCPDTSGSGLSPRILNGNNNGNSVLCPTGQVYCCSSNTDTTCGISSSIAVPGYIAISNQANFGEFPWMVLILTAGNGYIGGGALIDSQYVLTAAHKLPSIQTGLKVRLGEWDLSTTAEPYPFVEINVASIRIHESFNSATLQNDIAILKLASSVDFVANPHIRPICLPTQGSNYSNRRCLVSGYGADSYTSGSLANVLKKVDVPILPGNDCETRFRATNLGSGFNFFQDSFICAGGEAGKDACSGDGGSPLVCQFGTQYTLAGLVAWGVGCGSTNVPGAYVNIPNFITWINNNKV